MEFNNETLEAILENNASLTIEEVDNKLKNFPESKRALLSLTELIHLSIIGEASVDDWECDIAEIIFPEVEEQVIKLRQAMNEIKEGK